jgi:hypothetical protein
MTAGPPNSYTSFDGYRRIAAGTLQANALAVKRALERGAEGAVLIFDDFSGRPVDVDTRGSDAELVARLIAVTQHESGESTGAGRPSGATGTQAIQETAADRPRGRGRPKLGVVSREVTLLPRHWEWLATQPGGASVALRRLVEQARRVHADTDKTRQAHERAYHFMAAMAGDLPGFEEATRALFANNRGKFCQLIAAWPVDIRDHAVGLGFGNCAQVQSQ